jgi:ankyrin repeat protein
MLHIAALNGNQPMTRLLLERGCDPNVKDSNGWTALHLAVERGHQSVVLLLLDAGADLHAKTH